MQPQKGGVVIVLGAEGVTEGWPRGQFRYIRKGIPSMIMMKDFICPARRAGRTPPLLW
ncbi:hypothetical protein IMSAGC007_02075 [Lachnospiraceae bacterium]|nr:hypothetical protein IMSAGC007_02075 [Lachnospiraceae bacterium]